MLPLLCIATLPGPVITTAGSFPVPGKMLVSGRFVVEGAFTLCGWHNGAHRHPFRFQMLIMTPATDTARGHFMP